MCVRERVYERERRYEVAMKLWGFKIYLVSLQPMNCPDILRGHRYRILSNHDFFFFFFFFFFSLVVRPF